MPEEAAIRVWLEPGYDGGRVGCWMLDLPGSFAWGQSRAAALARAPAAVARLVLWLREHGEPIQMPELDETVVVEEVPATIVRGYERNAIFAADRRPITSDELETTIRRLDHARADLLELAGRVDRLDALPTDGEEGGSEADRPQRTGSEADRPQRTGSEADRPQRTGSELLRHVGSAEAWYARRLDPTARYDGPSREGDPQRFLGATRAWAIDRLHKQFAHDPALARTDEKGERWTLAKVLRRFLYHSFDHLEELDRRLATVDGRLDRVEVRRNARVDPTDLADLLRTAGLNRGRRSPQQIARLLAATRETVSAWDGERLVGFARAISDGVTNAYVSSVAVDPRWQDRGLGRRLIESLIDGREGMKFVLTARDGTDEFYRRLGFVPDPRVLVRQRRRGIEGPPGDPHLAGSRRRQGEGLAGRSTDG